jgi:hypothetical protein
MIRLPAEGKWVVSNRSDRRGNISKTKNITFDKDGYLTLSHSSRAAMNEAIDADFDEPAAIVRDNDYGYFVITHGQAFSVDEDRILGVRPTQIATAGVPQGDPHSDAVYSGQLLIVTQDTDVDYYDPAANTWTDTDITLTGTTGSQHPIENYISLSAFAVADVNTVKLYSSPPDATPTLLSTLTILGDFYITSLRYFNQNLYIGTMNRYGGRAYLYVWNGAGNAAQQAYAVDSNIIFDIEVHKDSIVLFIGSGQLLQYVGSGFKELDSLPIYYTSQTISDETNVSMFHNCLKSDGDLLLVNVSTSAIETKPTTQNDGIYCYDSQIGFLYHRYSLSGAITVIDIIDTSAVNTTTDQITVAAAPITGTEVIYDDGNSTAIGGLVHQKKYFIIKVDSTHVQLALTKVDALAATAIDLTGTGNNAQRLVAFPNTDFGQALNSRVAALFPIMREVESPAFGNALLWGGLTYSRGGSSQGVLGTVTNAVENRGYAVTTWLTSDELSDAFNSVTIKFSKFKSELDRIVVKYRVVDDRLDSIRLATGRWTATWTSTTTFTTTEVDFANAVVGDEVEFLRGGGAGYMAHITTISYNAGTYTVTIDEPYDYYESGDTSRFVFRNYRRLGTISPTSETSGVLDSLVGYKKWEFGKGLTGKQLQLKLELRGIETRIEDVLVNNKTLLFGSK